MTVLGALDADLEELGFEDPLDLRILKSFRCKQVRDVAKKWPIERVKLLLAEDGYTRVREWVKAVYAGIFECCHIDPKRAVPNQWKVVASIIKAYIRGDYRTVGDILDETIEQCEVLLEEQEKNGQ